LDQATELIGDAIPFAGTAIKILKMVLGVSDKMKAKNEAQE
jgi:hypothetical protein